MPEHPHLATLHAALESERTWQLAEHKRLLALPWDERVAAGVSWPPMYSEDVQIGRKGPVVTVRASRGLPLHDGITPGEPVLLAQLGAPDVGVPALVIYTDNLAAELRLLNAGGELPHWLATGGHRKRDEATLAITRRFDDLTFRHFAMALDRADTHVGPLRELLLDPQATPEVQLGELPDSLDELDGAQRRAAAVARGDQPLALIHGPPGTGKTWLLARLIRAWAHEEERVFGLADSNAAVDNLSLACAELGVRVLRMGSPERIGPAVLPLSVGVRVDTGPYAEALMALGRDIDRMISNGEHGREVGELIKQRRDLRRQAWQHEVDQAQVITSTLGTLAGLGERLPHADVAVVDEATQAVEPGVWSAVPLADKLVLVGDPEQLGPVILAPNNPLGRSLLQRLLEEQRLPMPMLQVQHRMQSRIQAMVGPVYGADYRPAPGVAQAALWQLPSVQRTDLTERDALWIDTAGASLDEARDPVTRSLYNAGEATLVVQVVNALLAAGLPPEDLGVIAPYSAQVQRLREALPLVEVATVNAFQGREKQAIVCSFVRSNPDGELGFVADGRRLTVAATRARRLWVGVGDSATLSSEQRFAGLIEGLEQRGQLESVWSEPWSGVLD